MAISYKDTRRAENKPGRSGPFLAAIMVVGGLLWFGPETTSFVESAVSTIISLPRF
jgi:hypothetical protein